MMNNRNEKILEDINNLKGYKVTYIYICYCYKYKR